MTPPALIRRPRFPVASARRYLLKPRAKRSFNTPLDAARLLGAATESHVIIEGEPGGELRLQFSHPLRSGTIQESLVLRDTGTGLRSERLQRLVFDPGGVEIRREEVDFRSGSIPLPAASYPEVMLPFLLCWQPQDKQQRTLFAWINDRFVARVQYQGRGRTTIDLPSGRREAIAMVMWPDLNDWVQLGKVLTRLAWPLVPKYLMWFDPEPPHTVLRYEGPYGPPGAPELVLELLGDMPA
jgi:hypothetical protein